MQEGKMPNLRPDQRVAIPAHMHPLFRTQIAIQNGVEKNLLFRTWGGLRRSNLRGAYSPVCDQEISFLPDFLRE